MVAEKKFSFYWRIGKTELQIVDYNGGRTLEDLIKFVEKQVSGDFDEEDEEEATDEGGEMEEEGDEVPRDEL